MDEDAVDPRVELPDICGVETVTISGVEWICVRKVHSKAYPLKSGAVKISDDVTARSHYMVRKYPHKPFTLKQY